MTVASDHFASRYHEPEDGCTERRESRTHRRRWRPARPRARTARCGRWTRERFRRHRVPQRFDLVAVLLDPCGACDDAGFLGGPELRHHLSGDDRWSSACMRMIGIAAWRPAAQRAAQHFSCAACTQRRPHARPAGCKTLHLRCHVHVRASLRHHRMLPSRPASLRMGRASAPRASRSRSRCVASTPTPQRLQVWAEGRHRPRRQHSKRVLACAVHRHCANRTGATCHHCDACTRARREKRPPARLPSF